MLRPLLIALALVAPPAQAATPTLVQATTGPRYSAGGSNYKIRLPEGSGAGNCLVLGMQFDKLTPVPTVTVTDDKSNAWTQGPTTANNDQHVYLFYALNVTSGTRQIDITLSASRGYFSATAAEFDNIMTSSAADGTGTGTGTATTITTSAFTTTVDNDLIIQWAIESTGGVGTHFTAGSNWMLLGAGGGRNGAMQYWVQPTAGSITPTMSQSDANAWASVAMALKSATQGTAPASSMRVRNVVHFEADADVTSPFSVSLPSEGNLLVASWIGCCGVSAQITGITDTSGNAWTQAGSAWEGAGGMSQMWYAANAMPSPALRVTVTFSSTNGGSTLLLYDIVNAASSAYDTTVVQDGFSSSINYDTVTITPAVANGVVIAHVGVYTNTVIAGTSTNLFDKVNVPGETSPHGPDENNGWSHYNNPNTSSYTFNWTNDAAPGRWTSRATAFTNNSASDPTISKTHSGDFTQGQVGASYTLTVSNVGTGPTSGTVTVIDTLPTGLTATGLAGTGWTCNVSTLTCTRSDVLGASASYPVITLTVDVASDAPSSVTNQATVSGGGETNTTNNSASDPTTIGVPAVSLSATSLAFGKQLVGTASAPKTVTMTNTGNAPLNITSIVASGDYAQTNDCGSQMAPGTSCTISVTFSPIRTGTRTGAVTITDDAFNSPQVISLRGTGSKR